MSIEQALVRNRLLAAIPPEEFAFLRPHLTRIDLPQRHVIQQPHLPIEVVHFIGEGWISLLATMEDGEASEVGMIGREGMNGVPLLFGSNRSIVEAIVQGPGWAVQLEAAPFREALHACPSLRQMLMCFSLALFTQVSQTAACNSRHQTEQRLARWLLVAHDRAEGDQFPMTHEFLSMMLGVRRASVTLAAGMLQKAELIRYGSGQITVLDRSGLEAVACECHGVVNREYRRLLGHDWIG